MILWEKKSSQKRNKRRRKNASLLYGDLNLTNQNDDYMH
mgnify:CR=1 FL=1